MKTKAYFLMIVIFIALIAGVIITFMTRKEEKKEQGSRPTAVVAVDMVRREMLDVRSFNGTLFANNRFELAPKVSGRLVELNVHLGDAVEPGQIVARIEDTEYTQEVQQAYANLMMGKAQLTEAKVSLEQAERELERNKQLHINNVYSDSQLDLAQTAYDAQAAIIAMREAEVARLTAIHANAMTRLEDTVIRATWPSGTRYIGARYVDEGELLAMNQPIASIIDISKLKATINVVERDYPKLRIGHPARLTTDAYPGRVFTATVSNISQQLAANARQAQVELEVDNTDMALRPGMFIRAEIEFGSYANAQTVPLDSIVKRNETEGVFLINADDTVSFVPIIVGLKTRELAVVLEPEIDRPVVTLGNHQLTDGAAIIRAEIGRKE